MNLEADFFASHLRNNLPRYYKNINPDQVCVQLSSIQIRPASKLFQYTLQTGEQERHMLVKIPLRRKDPPEQKNRKSYQKRRPRLVGETDSQIKPWLEFIALSHIQEHFARLGNPRFGALQVLDFLPDHSAIIMEELHDSSLRQLYIKASRFHLSLSKSDLRVAFHNAGAWLRQYHSIRKQDNVQERNVRSSDYIDTILQFSNYLDEMLNKPEFFQEIQIKTIGKAVEILPDYLPLGLGHGDFAMRNILVGHGNRVTALDTLARWRTPIYEDIGFFLTDLKTTGTQILSFGQAHSQARIKQWERDFLSGYFGKEVIPFPLIRLFEMQALLDKWAMGVNIILQQSNGLRNLIKFGRLLWMNHFYQIRAKQLLLEISKGATLKDMDLQETIQPNPSKDYKAYKTDDNLTAS